jgi:hypothetical protein
VAPSVLEVLGSWEDVEKLSPGWLAATVVAQAAAMASLWALQRLALHTKRWTPVITSQLAGSALARIAPGGGAIGAALQYRMLVEAGLRGPSVISGLTASNLLTFAVVMAMPVLAVPALLRGGVDRGLIEAAVIGVVIFVVLAIAATLLAAFDGPLRWLARTIQRVRNALRRGSEPLSRHGCPTGSSASVTGSSPRSGRAGSGRWSRPSRAGRSITRRCSRPWPQSATTPGRASCCSPSAPLSS